MNCAEEMGLAEKWVSDGVSVSRLNACGCFDGLAYHRHAGNTPDMTMDVASLAISKRVTGNVRHKAAAIHSPRNK